MTLRWPLTPHMLMSHARLYPRIIVSNSHGNPSKYVDTVTILQKHKQKVNDLKVTFDPTTVEVTCVTVRGNKIIFSSGARFQVIDFLNVTSLLHRPFFTRLFIPAEPSLFPTTKHNIHSYYHQREKGIAVLGLGRFSFFMVRRVKTYYYYIN